MDEVGLHDANDLTGSRIGCNQWVQGFGFAAKRYDQPSARMADFPRHHEQFFFWIFLLGMAGKERGRNDAEDDEQTRQVPA